MAVLASAQAIPAVVEHELKVKPPLQMMEGMTVKDWNLWQEQWEDYALCMTLRANRQDTKPLLSEDALVQLDERYLTDYCLDRRATGTTLKRY